jgi:glutaredoxin
LLPIIIFAVVAIAAGTAIRQGMANSSKPLVDVNHPKVLAGDVPKVTLYSTDWCSYCKAARTYFQRKQIPFEEKDIEKSVSAHKAYQQLGGNGVPFITIEAMSMQGFDRSSFKEAYLQHF